MNNVGPIASPTKSPGELRFIFHPSFQSAGAEKLYGETPAEFDHSSNYMPDDTTRDYTKRMHYAAYRAGNTTNRQSAARWRQRYFDYRNRIVVGNTKLSCRAVQKWRALSQSAEDMVGDCQIVLIKCIAAYNPWMGIRFSTYAFTCLMRALSRLSRRQAADKFSRSISLESLPYGEPPCDNELESSTTDLVRLDEYFKDGHTLLTPREKMVLTRRFQLNEEVSSTETLKQVGRDLGLSKERIRQLQISALRKLRSVLLAGAAAE